MTKVRLLLLAGALVVPLIAPPALAADDATPVAIKGGGWGHGVGMPQYGARGQADDGMKYKAILKYWYEGIGFKDVSQISGVPNTIRVGINYVTVGTQRQYRPFKWLDFYATGGNVPICLDGESGDGCSLKAKPGQAWRMEWNANDGCVLTRDGVIKHSGACGVIRLDWSDQPDTKVVFPELSRTFARGEVRFIAPVTRTWEGTAHTGFHIVVALDLDEYLYGLAEMPVSWPKHALRAQVVAARSFAAWKARSGIRNDCSCHLVWDTFDQAYRGWHSLNEGNTTHGHLWRAAVDDTSGEVAVHPQGTTTIAETYYFSSDGGATEDVWEVWGPDTPQYRAKYSYLTSKSDEWSPRFTNETSTIRWTRNTTAGHIATVLSGGATPMFRHLDELVAMSIEGVRTSGSPNRIAVTGIAAGFPSIEAFSGTQLVSPLGLTSHYIHSFEGLEPSQWPVAMDRNQVAISASQANYPGGAATVYLTIGKSHPHALAAGPAAARADAPVLLLKRDGRATPETQLEVQRLSPSRVVVVGPESDISQAALAELQGLVPEAAVVRVGGSNRFKSAAAVSQEAFPGGVHTVYIGSKAPFPTALLAAHTATAEGVAMLPVKPGKIPKAIRNELERLDPARIVVIGNSDEISNTVVAALGAYSPKVERISGGNEFALSVAVAQATHPGGAATVYLSVGRSHPYALGGSAVVDGDPGPLLYMRKGAIPTAVMAELERLQPGRIVVLSRSKKVAFDTLAELGGFALP